MSKVSDNDKLASKYNIINDIEDSNEKKNIPIDCDTPKSNIPPNNSIQSNNIDINNSDIITPSDNSNCETTNTTTTYNSHYYSQSNNTNHIEHNSVVTVMDNIPNSNNAKFDLIYKLVNEGHITPDKFNTESESLLGIACSTGHINLVKLLLQKGTDVNHLGANGEHTPLMEAVNSNSINIVKLLINNAANVNAKSKSGYTALHIACASGNLACTKLLIEAGADPTICSALLRTPVMEAAFCGHTDIIAYLLDQSPKTINSTEYLNNGSLIQNQNLSTSSSTGSNNDNFFKMCQINFRESPLLIASHRGHADAVRIILERMPFMISPEEDIMSSILEATIDCHIHVVKILLDFASKHFEIDEALNSPLTLAASGGHLGLVKLFIEYGANPNDFNAEGFTPLMEACREGHIEVMKYFLSSEVGVDVDTITKEHGETALTIACCSGNYGTIKYLIEIGNASLELGHSSPLMEASSENHIEIVKYLLEKGACIDSKNDVGRTALYQACEAGNIDIVKILVSHGAELDTYSDDGKTSLMRAVESGHLDIVDYLISNGAGINIKSSDNEWTALTIACLSGNVIMARLLVANGADPTIQFNDNSNLLIEATRAGHLNIVAFLLNPSVNAPIIQHGFENDNTSKSPTMYCSNNASETERLKSLIPPRILELYMKTNKITDKNVACNSMASAFQAYSKKVFETSNRDGGNSTTSNTHDMPSCYATTTISSSNKNTIKKPTRMCEYHNLIESMCAVDWNNLPSELIALSNSVNNEYCSEHCNNHEHNLACSPHRRNVSLLTLLEHLSLKGSKLTSQLINQNNDCLSISAENSSSKSTAVTNKISTHCQSNRELITLEDATSLISDECIKIIIKKINDFFKNCVKPFNDINHKTESNKDNPLMVACALGYVDIADYLIKNNVELNHVDRKGFSALMVAAAAGHFNVVKLLVSLRKIDVNLKSERNHETALTLATAIGRYDIVELLLDNGANIEHRNASDYSPLCVAAHNGYLDVLQLLLRRKALVNIRTGFTPLMLAVMNGHLECAEQLIICGADINVHIEANGSTALSLAVYSNRVDIVLLLLKHGALIDTKSKCGYTPFMEAVSSNNVAIGKVLLDHHSEASPITSSIYRDTAMILSAEKGHYEFLELLLQRKFPPDCRNKKGQTPSWLSATNGFLNCLILLYEHKANIELADYSGVTPLFSAFRNCHCEIVEWLASKVDQLPSLSLCRKLLLKSPPDMKLKFEHTYNILNRAIHRKSQIAEMNANRLLLEEERGKNKKKKKRKNKKSASTHKNPKDVEKKDNKIKITKNDDETAHTVQTQEADCKNDPQKTLEIESIRSTGDNSSQRYSATSSEESDSDGWISNQQQQQQHHIQQTTKKTIKPTRNMPDLSESITEITYINRSSVSRTIGRNGSTISAIKNKTVTFIDIDTITEVDGGRLCKTVVIGKKEGVDEAIRILKCLETNTCAAMEELSPYLGEYAPSMPNSNISTLANNSNYKISSHESLLNTSSINHKKQPHQPPTLRNTAYKLPVDTPVSTNEKSKKLKSPNVIKEVQSTVENLELSLCLNNKHIGDISHSDPYKIQKALSPPGSKSCLSYSIESKKNNLNHYDKKRIIDDNTAENTLHKINNMNNTRSSSQPTNSSKEYQTDFDDASWFPLLKYSEYLLSNGCNNIHNITDNNQNNEISFVKKSSFPQSLYQSTFIISPNEIAIATMNQNRHNSKLVPGKGRNIAPISKLVDKEKLLDSNSILQNAHEKFPSFISPLDQETLLRVTNAVAKEITSISYDSYNEFSSLKNAINEPLSLLNSHCQNPRVNINTNPYINSIGSTLPEQNPKTHYNDNKRLASDNASDTLSSKSSNLNELPSPFSTTNHIHKNDNGIAQSNSVPITPLVSNHHMCASSLAPSNVMASPSVKLTSRIPNYVSSMDFVESRHNPASSFAYSKGIKLGNEFVNPENNSTIPQNNPILIFCERYNLMDLYKCLNSSVATLDEIFLMSDSQFLDINVPIRYIQTLRMAINDFIQNNTNYNDNAINSKNIHGYTFYHSEYKS